MFSLLPCQVGLIFSSCFQDLGPKIQKSFKLPITPDLEVFYKNYFEEQTDPITLKISSVDD